MYAGFPSEIAFATLAFHTVTARERAFFVIELIHSRPYGYHICQISQTIKVALNLQRMRDLTVIVWRTNETPF